MFGGEAGCKPANLERWRGHWAELCCNHEYAIKRSIWKRLDDFRRDSGENSRKKKPQRYPQSGIDSEFLLTLEVGGGGVDRYTSFYLTGHLQVRSPRQKRAQDLGTIQSRGRQGVGSVSAHRERRLFRYSKGLDLSALNLSWIIGSGGRLFRGGDNGEVVCANLLEGEL